MRKQTAGEIAKKHGTRDLIVRTTSVNRVERPFSVRVSVEVRRQSRGMIDDNDIEWRCSVYIDKIRLQFRVFWYTTKMIIIYSNELVSNLEHRWMLIIALGSQLSAFRSGVSS